MYYIAVGIVHNLLTLALLLLHAIVCTPYLLSPSHFG